MPELIRQPESLAEAVAISAALTGFTVVDRHNERVGVVKSVNAERTCLIVEAGGSFFSLKQQHAVHIVAISSIDVSGFKIVLAASRDDVADAPEFHHGDARSDIAIAGHYGDRISAASP